MWCCSEEKEESRTDAARIPSGDIQLLWEAAREPSCVRHRTGLECRCVEAL